MDATQTTTRQYIAWDHAFSMPLILLVLLVCASLMLWSLTRERRILGNRTTTFFAVLRIVAIGTALWMLLAPTSVLEVSTSTKKAIAIATDVSASMTTVDPAGTADDLRWAVCQPDLLAENPLGGQLAVADRAVAAMGVAQRELTAAVADLEKHGSESLVSAHVQLASKSIQRSRTHLDELREHSLGLIDDAETAASTQSLLNRLATLLNSPEFDSLAELADTLHRGRTPVEAGWREGLPDWIGRTVTARRVFMELSESLAQAGTGTMPRESRAARSFQSRARGQRVASLLNQLDQSALSATSQQADLRSYFFDTKSRAVAGKSEAAEYLSHLTDHEDLAKATDLSAALRQVDRMRQDQPVAATFVLSDVAHNQAGERKPSEIAATMTGTPVYVVPIGNPSRLRDIDLVSTTAPSVAMRNDDVVIEAHIEAYQCVGETCVVQLLRDGQVIDFRNVLIDTDAASRSVRFEQRVSDIGTASFQIAVDPIGGEMTTENNFGEVEINVTRSDIKVLLADEHPRWEYRYLAQLFRRDAKVEADELLFHPRLIATGRREATGAFPITIDDWDQYDVVILGDIPSDRFPVQAQESLIKYLRTRGGTLIMIAGDRAMPQAYIDYPLAEAIPVQPVDNASVDPTEYSFRVTQQGRSHAALMIGETEQSTREAWDFVNQFSPLHHVSRWRIPLPTARSLIAAAARGEAPPIGDDPATQSTFLCWQPIGRGRVIYLSGPDTYRLRFLRGDSLHYRFWGQLMRWAIASDISAGNQLVRIRTSKTLYETDQVVDVEVELLDSEGGPVVDDGSATDVLRLQLVCGDDERIVPLVPQEDRPGHYRAEVSALPPGVYVAEPAGTLVRSLVESDEQASSLPISATFTVQADLPTELVDTRCNRTLAQQVSGLTGGQVLAPIAISEILELTDLEPIVTNTVQRQPLWLRWRYLWLVFGCLQTEWIIRKWRGLS